MFPEIIKEEKTVWCQQHSHGFIRDQLYNEILVKDYSHRWKEKHSRDFKEGISEGIPSVDKGNGATSCFDYENLLTHNSTSKNPELTHVNPASWLDAAKGLQQ